MTKRQLVGAIGGQARAKNVARRKIKEGLAKQREAIRLAKIETMRLMHSSNARRIHEAIAVLRGDLPRRKP